MTDIIENVSYAEKQTLFSSKEIIFRSGGRAKAWTISSQAQVIFLAFFFFISVWSLYSYYIYNRSGKIIHKKDVELVETRDAYVDLMTDFVTLHKNISGMLSSIDGAGNKKKVNSYKQQALVLEDKIKQITNEKEWISDEKISEKTTLSEAILQRDIAASERDELRKQLVAMEDTIKELKNAETEVLKKVQAIADKEVAKVKSAFNTINVPLKRKGLYFNALANSKKGSKGGLYVPARKHEVRDKKIDKTISRIFESVDDLQYYKEVIKTVPIGKPVWSYWVTSQYGRRSDPFNKKAASHKGVDLASRTGNKIKVKARGKVIKAGMAGGYGKLVVIDHGNGFQTKYAHLNKIYVKKGDYLEYDDTIGEVGTTGRSTGPHLHYEVIYMGKDVDPMPFIKAKIS